MALGALSFRIMLLLRRMAGVAERTIGDQQRYGSLRMTGVTGLVRGCRIGGMGYRQLGPGVTHGTLALSGVMVAMTVRTGGDGGGNRQSHRLTVALNAGYFAMAGMREGNRPLSWGAVTNCNRYGQSDRSLQGARSMAVGAGGLVGGLVVADLTAARGLKGESTMLAGIDMAGQAGQRGVPRVRE